jgi:phage gp36-like protein
MYATPNDLLELFGPSEIAGISRPDHIPVSVHVTGELLRLTCTGGDRSAFSAAERDAADHCLMRILFVLGEASKQMDSYLSRRYPLPLAAGVVAGSPLVRICADLARFAMDDDSVDKAAHARYQDALRWLDQVAGGQIVLAADPASAGGDVVRTTPGVSFFADREGF